MKPSNPTPMVKPAAAGQKWFVVDAADKSVGRIASRVAAVLRGKHKPQFTPHWDMGDFVVVVNAERVQLTGDKWKTKRYYRYSGYPGGLRSATATEMRAKHPERILEHAIKGMLPKSSLGRQMAKKLKIYAGGEHPHGAQQPQPLTLE